MTEQRAAKCTIVQWKIGKDLVNLKAILLNKIATSGGTLYTLSNPPTYLDMCQTSPWICKDFEITSLPNPIP